MSMLNRYKKSGGFIQLLNLLETCDKAKQEKLLKMIDEEDKRWSNTIRQKMLSMNKILSWSAEVLAEVIVRLPEMTVGIALHGMTEEVRQKIFSMMAHSQKRKIDEAFALKKPTPAEIFTAYNKIMTEVRSMVTNGYIRLEKIDAALAIEENIEEKIMNQFVVIDGDNSSSSGEAQVPNFDKAEATIVNNNDGEEVATLKRQLMKLVAENSKLKSELRQSLEKLEQIRKIA